MRRRSFLALTLAPLVCRADKVAYPAVAPRALVFPRDHGAHPEFRTEWWYVTGWLNDVNERAVGFQITFFRVRPEEESNNPSSFNPRQLLLAHAAIADPQRGRLLHEERAARAGLTLAHAELERTGVWLDDWRLELDGTKYSARIAAREFDLDLAFVAEDPPLLQGESGVSRKGHRPGEASYYYSRPNLSVTGKLNGREVNGSAWLDHEWSSAYLAPEAAGWDWCGINLAGRKSLMAFRMRDKDGKTHYAAPGTTMTPLRWWKSPRTGVSYPVSMRVQTEKMEYVLEPLMDDQELDARASSGTIYWEGAVRAFDKSRKEVGRGYLELTGYWKPMKL